MPTNYLKLLQRLKTFISREYTIQRNQLEKQWALPLAQRVQQGFAIHKYSDNGYDSQEWMFTGAGKVDGTIEEAMKTDLLAYPM